MKVILNRDACIGCGACAAICECAFQIDATGVSELVKENVEGEEIELVKDAIESCPTGAISLDENENKENKAA